MKTAPLLIVFALAITGSVASGEEVDDAARSAARKLGYDGVTAYGTADYALASDRLERAYAVLKVPTLGLWSARALGKIGHLVEASERYLEVGRLPLPELERTVHAKAQDDARVERAALMPRLAHVVVDVAKPSREGAVVTIDGRVVPAPLVGTDLPIDPGTHHIELRGGTQTSLRELVVHEGETQHVDLALAPEIPAPSASTTATANPTAPSALPVASASPPAGTEAPPTSPPPLPHESASNSTMRTAGWIGVGVGVAGVAFGAIVGGIAAKQNSDLDQVCTNNVCPPTSSGDVTSYERDRILSTVGFVVGAGGLAMGVATLLFAPAPKTTALVSVWFGGSSVGLRGKF